jgi:hypothetical protein
MRKKGASIWLAACLVALALAGAIVGCGGSSEAAPLTRAAFVKQANGICARAQDERKKGTKEAASAASGVDESEEEDALADALLEPVKTMTGELDDLGPPKKHEEQIGAIIAAFEDGTEKLETDLGSSQAPNAFAKADKLAVRYGLTACII